MKKNIIKMALGLALVITVGAPISTEAAKPVIVSEIILEDATVYKDIIEYRYAFVDGYLYRRLFNYSRNEWIGEWEFVV